MKNSTIQNTGRKVKVLWSYGTVKKDDINSPYMYRTLPPPKSK